jgi:L-ascorbate metabolism protein UlaG (beta-lactamase superfamily)
MDETRTAEVWYLDNSGFALKTSKHFLIFDYCNDRPFEKRPGLDGGVIDTAELRELDVVVFASHAHGDHFKPSILKWNSELRRVCYVMSYDIRAGQNRQNTVIAFPNEAYELDRVKVRTLKSTDEGVAFILEVDGLKIYHAGDLNWWHWEGEPDEDNRAMAGDYQAQLDLIKGELFDIAFVPVDPRLENEFLWGLDYFMRTADAKAVFPMHFQEDYSIFDRLEKDPVANEYRGRIKRISRRGEHFVI